MLLVCSKSTRRFFPEIEKVKIVSGTLDTKILLSENSEEEVIACGGGAVVDAAKIISKNPITCYPTTAAGSASTEHAVVWNGSQKISVKCDVPKKVIVQKDFLDGLPSYVVFETKVDMISHCFDSFYSKKATRESKALVEKALDMLTNQGNTNENLVIAGNIAGRAIQMTPTTILHSLSYPLTGNYGISHGKALSYFLPKFAIYKNFELKKYIQDEFEPLPVDIDLDKCLDETLSYAKVNDFEFERKVNIELLRDIIL